MRPISWAAGGLGIFAILLLTACGGSGDDATSTPQAANPVEVQVTLSEMTIDSSVDTFTTGVPYHFVVSNTGALPHEMMLIEPMETGAMSMTEMDQMALAVVEEDDLEPGATYEFDLTFTKDYPADTLEFACHIAGHYEAGMRMPVTVKSN